VVGQDVVTKFPGCWLHLHVRTDIYQHQINVIFSFFFRFFLARVVFLCVEERAGVKGCFVNIYIEAASSSDGNLLGFKKGP